MSHKPITRIQAIGLGAAGFAVTGIVLAMVILFVSTIMSVGADNGAERVLREGVKRGYVYTQPTGYYGTAYGWRSKESVCGVSEKELELLRALYEASIDPEAAPDNEWASVYAKRAQITESLTALYEAEDK